MKFTIVSSKSVKTFVNTLYNSVYFDKRLDWFQKLLNHFIFKLRNMENNIYETGQK